MFSISHHFNLADGQLTTRITTLFTSLLNERRDRKVRALPSSHLQRERSFSLQVGHPPGLKGPKAGPLDQLPSHEHALDPRPLRHLSDLQTAGQRRPVLTEHSSRFTLRCNQRTEKTANPSQFRTETTVPFPDRASSPSSRCIYWKQDTDDY